MAGCQEKVIVVVGATSLQGIGLVRAIIDEQGGEFSCRAIVKDASSEAADWMKKQGVDVRDVDVGDEAALTEALRGAYGLYAATYFWEHFNPDLEIHQAKAMAAAAKTAGIRHVIWLTLEDTRKILEGTVEKAPTLMGKYKIPHFDAKASVDHVFVDANLPTTFLMTAFYWENFISFGMGPKKTRDGKLAIMLPMGKKRLGGMATEDIGKCALGIFKRRDEYVGRRVGLVGEILTVAEMAEKMSKALGKEIVYREITYDEYRKLDNNSATIQDLANMFIYFNEKEDAFLGLRSLEESKKLNPDLMTFDQWLDKKKDYIPVNASALF